MFTRHAIAVAVLVAATAAAAQPAPSPATATPPKPVAKPAAAAPSQPAPSKPAVAVTTPAPAVSAQPATVALAAPLPRQKPKWPPSPRSKPEAPVEVASAPLVPAPATPALAAPAATQPIAASGQEALAACGNACSEILFKTVDNCLWVQSANPRPITFSAEVGGRPVALKLEGADPKKADAHTAALKGAPAKDEPAYHTRLHDPFVSVAPGIPAYRARLGPPTTCVKSRNEIQKFTATFAG